MANHFLQSKEWEEFQRSLGRKVWRVEDVLVVKLPLIFAKSYLYSAGSERSPSIDKIKNIAKTENAIFFKFEPTVNETGSDPVSLGFIKSMKEVQPQKTLILDITKREGELLNEMHQKTRYNIRVAERHGMKVLNSKNKNLEEFWGLIQKTSQRDNFSTHPKEYYKKLLELPFVELFSVEYGGKIVAASIVLFYGNTAYYLHGASDYERRDLMAPYLLHWETIKYAKKGGLEEYDLWGVDEKKWPGVTRFKRGFGGKELEYVGSYDYIFSIFLYKLYNLRSLIKNVIKI